MFLKLSKLILFFYFIPLSLELNAQNDSCKKIISGVIFDLDSKKPLPYATVRIKNSEIGAIANEQGEFILEKICKNENDLEIRFLGYKTITHHHDFHHPSPIIYLTANETILEGVVVENELKTHQLKSLESKKIKVDKLTSMENNVGSLFAQNTGVGLLKTGQNIVKPIIHGLHSNRVLMINNGVRHAYQSWGAEHGVEINASQINQIQLIKGASTVRYGADALGGVILFDAPTPSYQTKLNGETNIGYQSNGRSFTGEISMNKGYKRAAWVASISGTKQGDLHSPNYSLTNTGKEEFGFTVGSKFHFPSIDLEVFMSHFNQNLGVLRGSVVGNLNEIAQAIGDEVPFYTSGFSYEINNPRQKTAHSLAKLKASLFVGKQQFDFQYAFQQNIRKEFDVRRGGNNQLPAMNLRLETHSIDLDWDHSIIDDWNGTLGVQFLFQNSDNLPGTNTIPFIPNYNTTNIGIFDIESYTRKNTTYELGIRFDFMLLDVRGRDSSNDIFRENLIFNNFTFTLGFVKKISDSFSFRSNIGTAWRAPNVNELYSFGKHESAVEYGLWRYTLPTTNADAITREILTNNQKEIKSEQGLKWISSINYSTKKIDVEITPYINWIANYFFLRPHGITENVRGTFPYFLHDQTDAIYTGVDLDVIMKWGKKFHTTFKLAYVFAKDMKNNQYFVGIPPLNIQLGISKQIRHFIFKIEPVFEAQQYFAPPIIDPVLFNNAQNIPFERSRIFDFLDAPDAFFLVNASVTYKKDKLALKIKVDNLFNQKYRSYTDNLRYFANDLGFNLSFFASYAF